METERGDIVVVDDNTDNLRVLVSILKNKGYQARPVTSGALALDAIFAKPPALILLDIMMPEMDGLEVCRELKAAPEVRDIPVIFITALDELEEKLKAFAAGGADYITKP
ncbi:MAG TPA: response regulator, partial [Desulfosalsimonadaceae bacterium]|nr:response regulator [Desulfosalsimonadaceae bacterium]